MTKATRTMTPEEEAEWERQVKRGAFLMSTSEVAACSGCGEVRPLVDWEGRCAACVNRWGFVVPTPGEST